MTLRGLGAIAEHLAEAYRLSGELLAESTDPRANRLRDLIFEAVVDLSIHEPEQTLLAPADEPAPTVDRR